MKTGFVPALGTPLDEKGELLEDSYKKEIEMMIGRAKKRMAAKYLDNIIAFRDFFVEMDLWPVFSAAMNLLGCEGFFAPDWATPSGPEAVEKIRQKMIEIGELP